MKTSSCKAKGRRLQKAVVASILKTFPHLSDRDVQSTSMGATGEDVKLSQAAYWCTPVSWECKNKETNKSLLKDWEQASSHSDDKAVLVLSANNSPILAVVELDYLMYLFLRVYNDGVNKNEQNKV